jgi:cation:H+ antiporter
MTFQVFLLLGAGLAVLSLGAEFLVRGAARLAASLGIPTIIVGLTVVAIGTSAPELVVTVRSAISGRTELAMGNVVGSNIFNILVILGLSSLIAPLIVSRRLIRRDVPLMIGASVLVFLMSWNGTLTRWEGLLLLSLAALYIGSLVASALRSGEVVGAMGTGPGRPPVPSLRSVLGNIALVVGGLAGLIIGSSWLIDGAVEVARSLGVTELIIGLTLLAGGTSLPEVAASLAAAFRGQRDMAVGNVVGSNLFNLLMVLGAGAALAPGGIPVADALIAFDLPVMLAVAVACLPVFFTGASIDRWEGIVFIGYYAAFVVFLFLDAVDHATLPLFSGAMLLFVIPITVVTLVVVSAREWRRPPSGRKR